ncbi:MAG TPA: DUF3237 domain-containing protein [Polyangiales bacterium]|nr:DUF3237 domain-containing protein [Polyangiales bacterium]
MPNAALRPFLQIDADLGPMTPSGATPSGELVLVPLLGGTFQGDDVRGELLSGGADWQDVRSDRALEISARYLLRSDQAELIEVRSNGLLAPTAAVRERLARGEHPPLEDYYWRTALRFRSAAPRLASWNDLLAVAFFKMLVVGSGLRVHLDVYEVL